MSTSSLMHSGYPVWHDLFTSDVENARSFYSNLLGWSYHVEHASDFVWHAGEADYPLIVVSNEAHGGMVKTHGNQPPQWLAFVDVDDVDLITQRAQSMGADIIRAPFDIPGVGYCSVIADPQGALISPFKACHGYAPPKNLFVWEQLISRDVAASSVFYCVLFDWSILAKSSESLGHYTIFHASDNTPLAGVFGRTGHLPDTSQWIPYFPVAKLPQAIEHATSLGAKALMSNSDMEDLGDFAIFNDPTGSLFGLVTVPDSIR